MDSALPMALMNYRRPELLHASSTIFGGFVDLMFSPEVIRKAAGMRTGFSGMKTSRLCHSVYSDVS